MRLDQVTAEIRPRSDWEAVDLGFALVRRSFWRCITVWWLALGLPMAVATVLLWQHPFVVMVLFWWAKPAGSRLVLFELSRRLFGEEPTWKSVWREIPRVWWRRFFYRFLWARFSPWLPLTLAVEDLEGLRGKPYRQRCGQIARRGGGAALWTFFISEIVAILFGLGILVLLLMLLPKGQESAWQSVQDSFDIHKLREIPLLLTRTVVACMMVGMSLTDVFGIGAGFGIYINNRTWIEGWDVELAFKRLAYRLGKVSLVAFSFLMLILTTQATQATETPAEAIKRIKADPVFIVHTEIERRQKETPASSRAEFVPSDLMANLMYILEVCVVVLLVVWLGWVVWTYRHVFLLRGRKLPGKPGLPAARVVMGMAVSPDTLPPDVPTAAWALWQQGRHQEALGLLYRGSISKVIELARVEIHESDTEGDCMRRVELSGAVAHPDYFREITGHWIRLAYAGADPQDAEVQLLCQRWPFDERRVR